MPKIAEIAEISGGAWVRVEIEGDEGQITLWTEEEKAAAIRAAVEAEREAIACRLDECCYGALAREVRTRGENPEVTADERHNPDSLASQGIGSKAKIT